jgi:hypothetical protein
MNINDTSNNVYFTKWKGHCVVYYSNFAMQTEQMEKQRWETCWRSFNIMKFGIFVIFPQVSIESYGYIFLFGYFNLWHIILSKINFKYSPMSLFGCIKLCMNGTNLKYFVGRLILYFLWTIANNFILLSDAIFSSACACAISGVSNFWPCYIVDM